MSAAHAAGTRVALTITLFAWTSADRAKQIAVLGNDAARQRLADQAAAAVAARGADGVNVDAEPIASGYADEFADFVRRLRTSLDSIAPGYEITVDVTGEVANYPLEALVAPGAADAIFIMGYDYRGSSTGNAGSIAPIAGPAYDLNETLRRSSPAFRRIACSSVCPITGGRGQRCPTPPTPGVRAARSTAAR